MSNKYTPSQDHTPEGWKGEDESLLTAYHIHIIYNYHNPLSSIRGLEKFSLA